MKRSKNSEPQSRPKIAAGLDEKLCSSYDGYRPAEPRTEIDVVKVPENEEEVKRFFELHVVKRKPCKIVGIPEDISVLRKLKPSNIQNVLPREEILTIEKKNEGGFGSGATRLKMSFGQFLSKILNAGEEDLYLTTQYLEDDPNNGDYSTDEEEKDQVLDDDFDTGSITFDNLHDDFDDLQEEEPCGPGSDQSDSLEEQELRIKELYQPPMTNLLDDLPETPKFLDYLIPQQINLWIGAAKAQDDEAEDDKWLSNFDPGDPNGQLGLGRNVPGGGSSSGLHHDHADNLYVPIAGHKRFTLFAPCDAAKMYTVGTIRHLFASGVIDYVADRHAPLWRQLRDDGAITAEVYKTLLDSDTLDPQTKKHYEDFLRLDVQQQLKAAHHKQDHLDPPSFSTIPPCVVHLEDIKNKRVRDSIAESSKKRWPRFFNAHRITVDLKPGEMLYLPTGWFHEVTSYGDDGKEDKNVHVAANYWFIPPTGRDISNVYLDSYWPNDFAITQRALKRMRRHV
ncbi:hypothetical protein HG536_0F04350 [Torulaspora globosa]|uniref:JmjC domain-containing protein n=1 Tax=Torulaspora globosa TaxID=48254 RepID=A0A7G3ZKS3_9SACH|nr:uncharacterized protein HG536_0F04350 [Torulaspora globosa]QLL34109.1 hypothetical protein HG536_0F04350 [Torulaspora globosa]